MNWTLIDGDCRDVLAAMKAESVNTCVTSPPYFGLRDYGHGGLGTEATPDEFVAGLVGVFREVRRVLTGDGTLWLNLGDSYCGAGYANRDLAGHGSPTVEQGGKPRHGSAAIPGVKSKDLLGIPWMVAFALRADGWYLRSDIIWHKPNPMPESVGDRPTKAHEYLFLLAKSKRYYYDSAAVAEPCVGVTEHDVTGPARVGVPGQADHRGTRGRAPGNITHKGTAAYEAGDEKHRTKAGLLNVGARSTRNKRDVWTVASAPYRGAHFATFPPNLIEPCILAGCPEGGSVLDCFAGAGTTGMVALRHGRSFVGVELNPEYAALGRARIIDDNPLFNAAGERAA